MEEVAWDCMVNHSPYHGLVIAAGVWHSGRCIDTVVSADGGLHIEGEAECVGFAR
jgi:hypothetical protein